MKELNFNTLKDRLNNAPCPIGKQNLCCRLCLMGPCRFVQENQLGACGASAELITARNILRFVAGGAATHCGHALHTAKYLGKKLPQNYIKETAPHYLYTKWQEMGILPSENAGEQFMEISEAIHMTTMGVNADYKNVLANALKIALIDGYYGLHLATELEDSKIGRPEIKNAKVNLSCIDENKINIAVHGHEPLLAMAISNEAKKHQDINLVGVCCTGSTILAQAGIPLSAHFSLQEDVLMTGLIDALVVDVHCIMPSVGKLCDCYHTKLITTNEIGRFPDAIHMPIKNENQAEEIAREIISIARANKNNRIADAINNNSAYEPQEIKVGFTEYNINTRKLAEEIDKGHKKGIIAVVGCVNPRAQTGWINTYKELAKDYFILSTGCMAFELAKEGLSDGKDFFHIGSCVNNARIAEIFKLVSQHLRKEISQLKFIVSAPMPITEKSAAIALFFANMGCDVHIGVPHFFNSNYNVTNYLQKTLRENFNSKLMFNREPDTFLKEIKSNSSWSRFASLLGQ